MGLYGNFDLAEGNVPRQECIYEVCDPFAFIGMILTPDEQRFGSSSDCLIWIDRDNRDRIFVVFHIFRGEMSRELEDFPGITIIPVEIECLMNGPALRFDPKGFPAHRIDEPYSLIAIADNQQIAIERICE
jgi:hypothetical protein